MDQGEWKGFVDKVAKCAYRERGRARLLEKVKSKG